MNNQYPYQNPTDEQRRQLLLDSLTAVGRRDDFENILKLLSPPPEITNFVAPKALNNVRIGIIGGGLAGLAAAYELRKLGASITIFDAQKERVGGRVDTHYFDRSSEFYGELGAARIPASHETVWYYINLFGLNTESLTSPDPNNIIYAHNIRIRREPDGRNVTRFLYPYYDLSEKERNTPWNQLRNYALSTMLYSLTPDERAEILKILPEYSQRYAAISRLSTRQIFEMLELSQGAIELITAVEPFTEPFLNMSHDEIMNTEYSLDFLNTYRISGGTLHLPMSFYNSLMSNDPKEIRFPTYFLGKVELKSRSKISGIYMAQENEGVYLRCSSEKKGDTLEQFDYVICAIPFSTLREVDIKPFFRNQKMQAIKEYHYMDGQKTLFLCRKRFWEEDRDYGRMNGGISVTDLPIQTIIYPPDHIRCKDSESCTPDMPGVLTPSYNLGQDSIRQTNQPEALRLQMIKHNVEEVHGLPEGALDTLVENQVTTIWSGEPWARGAFAAGYPGQKMRFLHSMTLPEFEQRVFFAGEHVSTKQGWMQGALYSGKEAANRLAEAALTR
ncbi:MAG: amine oxidase [Bacillota bacterium]|jgi:monoamine oxidase|nr:amine oxidase [Bacillota bacterium]